MTIRPVLICLFFVCISFAARTEARSASDLLVVAQAEPDLAGTYEGRVERRFVKGPPRETRLYRVTMNPDLNTGKVLVFEDDGKVRNELGFVVRKVRDLYYEGQTQPINAVPGYVPDKIRIMFAPDGKSAGWYHSDGTTEGSGMLFR
jgi:hypothetical protein